MAWIVKFETPVPFGVPVIAPLAALSDKPAGSDPAVSEYVYGPVPPVALTPWL